MPLPWVPALSASPPPVTAARAARLQATNGDRMGDRDGKKAKGKNQQQPATKQEHKEQNQRDKVPARPLGLSS